MLDYAALTWVAVVPASNRRSRKYKNNGSPNDTPTVRIANTTSHLARTPSRAPSIRLKASSVIADINTSMPKKAPIRVEKSSRTNSGKFSPCCSTHGTNCQYGTIMPATQRAMYKVLAFMSAF